MGLGLSVTITEYATAITAGKSITSHLVQEVAVTSYPTSCLYIGGTILKPLTAEFSSAPSLLEYKQKELTLVSVPSV